MAQKSIRIRPGKDALIDVDLQPTFMPGGGLPVADGDKILPVVKRVHRHFDRDQRYLTLDRHPRGHISLASSYGGIKPYTVIDEAYIAVWTREINDISPTAKFGAFELHAYLSKVGSQTLWPDHALIGSGEDVLHRDIDPLAYAYAQIKGTDPLCDSYSAFRDNLGRHTNLMARMLFELPGLERLFVTGLAYDFCVGWTALDARRDGLEVLVIKDATRPVDLPGTVADIEKKFADKGVRVIQSSDIRST